MAAKPLKSPKAVPDVNYGNVSKICPQMQVGWVPKAQDFLTDYFGALKDISAWTKEITPDQYDAPPAIDYDRMSEDCLTLDVMVPRRAFNDKNYYLREFPDRCRRPREAGG